MDEVIEKEKLKGMDDEGNFVDQSPLEPAQTEEDEISVEPKNEKIANELIAWASLLHEINTYLNEYLSSENQDNPYKVTEELIKKHLPDQYDEYKLRVKSVVKWIIDQNTDIGKKISEAKNIAEQSDKSWERIFLEKYLNKELDEGYRVILRSFYVTIITKSLKDFTALYGGTEEIAGKTGGFAMIRDSRPKYCVVRFDAGVDLARDIMEHEEEHMISSKYIHNSESQLRLTHKAIEGMGNNPELTTQDITKALIEYFNGTYSEQIKSEILSYLRDGTSLKATKKVLTTSPSYDYFLHNDWLVHMIIKNLPLKNHPSTFQDSELDDDSEVKFSQKKVEAFIENAYAISRREITKNVNFGYEIYNRMSKIIGPEKTIFLLGITPMYNWEALTRVLDSKYNGKSSEEEKDSLDLVFLKASDD